LAALEESRRNGGSLPPQAEGCRAGAERLVKTTAYAKFLKSPAYPGGRIFNEEYLNGGLRKGHEAFVVERYRKLAQGRPGLPGIAQVRGMTTGPHPPAMPDPGIGPDGRESRERMLRRLNDRREGKINRAEYSALKYGSKPPAQIP
jgi:hypothetical protein